MFIVETMANLPILHNYFSDLSIQQSFLLRRAVLELYSQKNGKNSFCTIDLLAIDVKPSSNYTSEEKFSTLQSIGCLTLLAFVFYNH